MAGVKKRDNTRRFRKAYISLARKNGKSLIVAGIALYEFLFGKNPAASRQVVAAANTKTKLESFSENAQIAVNSTT